MTFNEKMLEAIQRQLLNAVTDGVTQMSVDGQNVKYESIAELEKAKSKYQMLVNREKRRGRADFTPVNLSGEYYYDERRAAR